MRIVTTATMKARNIERGDNWFEPGAMRFFGTRLPRQGYQGADGRTWFVASHQRDWDQPRFYALHVMDVDGSVDTIDSLLTWWYFRRFDQRRLTEVAKRLARGEVLLPQPVGQERIG